MIRRRPPTLPWRAARLAVVDVETTGLDLRRDEVLAIGVVAVEEGRIRAGSAHHWLVRPDRMPTPETIVVHGLRPADVAAAPAPADIAGQLAGVLRDRVVVAHSAWVERAFVGALLRHVGERLAEPVLDTEVLGRRWLLERDGRAPAQLSLDALAAALGLPLERRHHALGDALTTAQCFLALATHLDARRVRTIRDLARAEDALRSTTAFGTVEP